MPQSPAGAVAASCWPLLAVCLLLASVPTALAQWVEINPGECKALKFYVADLSYIAAFFSPDNLTEGCIFRISNLYMKGTCTSQPNNTGEGCSGSGSVVNESSCEGVFADAPSGTLHTLSEPNKGLMFNSDSLCRPPSNVGYVFASYNCKDTAPGQPLQPLRFNVTISWSPYTGCSSSSWSRYIIGVVCALIAVFLFAFAFWQCFKHRPPPTPAAVQLAPPGSNQGMGYYTGSAAYGVDGTATYAGAWGSAPGAGPQGYPLPAGYPPAGGAHGGGYGMAGYGAVGYGTGGYAPALQQFSAPMATVTLGQPADEDISSSGPGGAGGPPVTGMPLVPAGSRATAALKSGGDLQAKV